LSRKNEKKELAGPPPTTAILDPSNSSNPDLSSLASDDNESATDFDGERRTSSPGLAMPCLLLAYYFKIVVFAVQTKNQAK
jgi:hypothetical protein